MIIGGGPAGASAAKELRKLDENAKITLISKENLAYYERTKIINLISKSCPEDDLFLEGRDFYEKFNVNFHNGRALNVLTDERKVIVDDGSTYTYDSLLIASGGSPIVFPWNNTNLEGISTLYTLEDANKVANIACEAKKAVIIGGGSIAMKVVHNLEKIGLNITIIEKASHLWPIGFDRKVARIIEAKLMEKGIKIHLNEEVTGFTGENGKLKSVLLKKHGEIEADLAIITIGMRPNISFLNDSKVKTDIGVLVDEHLRTNIPNIFAAGDVAQMRDPLHDEPVLHPTWGNAKKQGKIAARNMVGNEVEYEGKGGKWVKYGDMGPYTLKTQPSKDKWGKLYKLSSDYSTYKWNADDGYNSFSKWVG